MKKMRIITLLALLFTILSSHALQLGFKLNEADREETVVKVFDTVLYDDNGCGLPGGLANVEIGKVYNGFVNLKADNTLSQLSLTISNLSNGSCYDLIVNSGPAVCLENTHTLYDGNPAQFFRFTLQVVLTNRATINFSGAGSEDEKGAYTVSPDGISTVVAEVSPMGTWTNISWSIAPADGETNAMDCTLAVTNGVANIGVGTREGTLMVRATGNGVCFAERFLKLKNCSSCSGGYCDAPADTTANNDSVNVRIGLGRGNDGRPLSLNIYALSNNVNLGSPLYLKQRFICDEVELVYASGALRQAKAPQCLANVITDNANKYHLDFYYPNQYTSKVNGLYEILSGQTPFAVVTIEDYDNLTGSTTNLYVTHQKGSTVTTNDFRWQVNGWSLTTGNGLRREYTAYTTSGSSKVITHNIYSGSGTTPVSVWGVEKPLAGWTNRVTKEFWGQGSERKENTYAYNSFGNVTNISRWDGSWEIRQYDSSNRLSKVLKPIMNNIAASAATTQNCHYIEYSYVACGGSSGDNGSLKSAEPRGIIERMSNSIVSKKLFIIKADEKREIVCLTTNAGWSDASNLITITRYYTNGFFPDKIKSTQYPNGTWDLYYYSYEMVDQGGTMLTENLFTVVDSGEPRSGNCGILNGVRKSKIESPLGVLLKTESVELVDNSLTECTNLPDYMNVYIGNRREKVTYQNFDQLNRPQLVATVIGDSSYYEEDKSYDCCGLSSMTDREGITTSYGYDSLKRPTTELRNGITLITEYDPAGQVVSVSRQGSNGSPVMIEQQQFDTAGRLLNSTNAMNKRTQYAETVSNGILTRTTTYPDNSTRVEDYYPDGSLKRITGTAVHGISNYYGAGSGFTYVVETKLKSDGSPSSEWKKSWKDMAGRLYRVDYSGGGAELLVYNQQGQLFSQTDADGVKTLYFYNSVGEREYVVLDWNRNGQMDTAGLDRITRYVSAAGLNGKTTDISVWNTDNSNTSVAKESVYEGYDGKTRSRTIYYGQDGSGNNLGVTTSLTWAYGSRTAATRTETTTFMDGSYEVASFKNGLRQSLIRYALGGTRIGETSYTYDDHNRQKTVTDKRTGAVTTFVYDNADRAVTNSVSVSGQTTQTTVLYYDDMGRVWKTVQPDNNCVTNTYYLTGESSGQSGARTYPVSYGYDYAGRMTTMTNWSDFAAKQGEVVTTWHYDVLGHMTNKVYANSSNVVYTYTSAGRLLSRKWSRGITTSYTTNAFGEATTVTYSDGSTPTVNITYDRLGRQKTMTRDNVTTTFTYDNAGSLLCESISGGVLDSMSITKTYNSALKPETLSVQGLSSGSIQTTYGYLNNRLRTVTHFGNIATYSYWPTSSLVSSIVFNNGTADKMTESRAYDGFNRLTERKTVAGASTVADYDYAYNLANQRTRIDIGGTSPSYVSIDYDNLGQVTNATKKWTSDQSQVVGQQFAYQFNDIGNRKTTTRDGRVAEYANNNVNQITSRTVPGYLNVIGEADSASTVKVNSKTAERKGTYYRKELQVPNATPLWVGITNVAITPNGSAENYVTNLGSVYVPPANESFIYDGDGNLTSDGLWNYTWDGENRLTKVESRTTIAPAARYKVEWIFDALGRRISEATYNWNTGTGAYVLNTTVLYVYDGWQCIGELTTSKAVQRTYAWGLDMSGTLTGAGGVGGLLMIKSTGVGSHFYSYDGNGNVVNLVSATDGTESARYEYDSFGIVLRATGTMALINPYRFSTKRQEAKTDVILYEYRPYTPSLGRWLSRDPIEEKGGLNLYGFIGNDTISQIDYLGLSDCCCCCVDDLNYNAAERLPVEAKKGWTTIGHKFSISGSFSYIKASNNTLGKETRCRLKWWEQTDGPIDPAIKNQWTEMIDYTDKKGKSIDGFSDLYKYRQADPSKCPATYPITLTDKPSVQTTTGWPGSRYLDFEIIGGSSIGCKCKYKYIRIRLRQELKWAGAKPIWPNDNSDFKVISIEKVTN